MAKGVLTFAFGFRARVRGLDAASWSRDGVRSLLMSGSGARG